MQTTQKLEKIHFLIHGFCYACLTRDLPVAQTGDPMRRFLERESECAGRWYRRLGELAQTEALAIIPFGSSRAAADFYAAAGSALGDRCFLLDSSDPLTPAFWQEGEDDPAYDRRIRQEMRDAFAHQHFTWNKEELHTALHTLACCRQFQAMLAQRGYTFDPAAVASEAWGASFEGCVVKYSLNLRRLLGFANPIEIDYATTVPDTAFLLDAAYREYILLDNGLRLFLFEYGEQVVGLYTFTGHSLADPPAGAILNVAGETVTVKSKQGIRLWPLPEAYVLPNVEPGCDELPQDVVKPLADGLQVPVSAGLAYRLAKAPAYIFMPAGMPYSEARSILVSAKMG